ncbi:hypothetical protein [Brachybacterium paraconglomeratum]|uniref:hypothetical protein n=1 Tax=Brachybacterium paraconglomeratum TaxID=173362 RepID=UPI0022AE836C|nr:hypothetical protein [Brachybacterium paraconglomeratum]MCZ4326704.1 hypothetical protein [Brachybacterium paraconglomeratum]
MVTASTPPHPLRAGTIPAALWTGLLLKDLAMSIVVVGLGVPAFARMHDDPKGMLVTGIIAYACLLVVVLLSRWARRAVQLHTPGALRTYSWRAPGRGPRAIDVTVAAVRGLAAATAVVMLTAAVDPSDPSAAAIVLFALGAIGGYGVVAGLWDIVEIVIDRLPGWNRELLRPGLVVLVPATMATVPLLTMPPSDARGIGGFAWILLAGATALLRFAARILLSTPERSVASGLRDDVEDATDALAETILSRTNPAPTLAHRREITRRVRVGMWVAAIAAALLVVFFMVAW